MAKVLHPISSSHQTGESQTTKLSDDLKSKWNIVKRNKEREVRAAGVITILH